VTKLRSPDRGSFNDWLATMTVPSFAFLVGSGLATLITVAVLVMMVCRIPIDAGSLAVVSGLATTVLGLATVGYNIKRKSWRPDLTVVRPGSDPNDPLVQSLGGTEYHVHAPAYLDGPAPRNATAVPAVAEGTVGLPPGTPPA
jgi:hypothetical protein